MTSPYMGSCPDRPRRIASGRRSIAASSSLLGRRGRSGDRHIHAGRAQAPFPIADLQHIFAVLADVARVLVQLVLDDYSEVSGLRAQTRHSINDEFDQMKAIQFVEHRHVEGRGRRSLLPVTTNMQIVMVGPTVGQLVNQRGIAVVGTSGRRERLVP